MEGGGWGVGYYGHRKSTAAKSREIHAGVNMGLIAFTLHICRKPQEPAHSVSAGIIARVYYNIHIPAFLSEAFFFFSQLQMIVAFGEGLICSCLKGRKSSLNPCP